MGSKEISERVKALRKMRGMTQKELAEKAGVGIATVRNIERGKYWTSEVMDKINNALGGAVY